jgi:hypothetical protein
MRGAAHARAVTQTMEPGPAGGYYLPVIVEPTALIGGTSMRRYLIPLASVLLGTGCVAAAAGGAAAGVYLTSRGAEAVVEGSVENVATRAQAVMGEMGIVKEGESTEDQGAKHVLKGKQGDLDVNININRETDKTSKVEVTARKNLAEWDKDYAKDVVNRIVEKG